MILWALGGHDRALRKQADRSRKWTNHVPSPPLWRNQGSPFAPFPSAYSYHPRWSRNSLQYLYNIFSHFGRIVSHLSLSLCSSLPFSKKSRPCDHTSVVYISFYYVVFETVSTSSLFVLVYPILSLDLTFRRFWRMIRLWIWRRFKRDRYSELVGPVAIVWVILTACSYVYKHGRVEETVNGVMLPEPFRSDANGFP